MNDYIITMMDGRDCCVLQKEEPEKTDDQTRQTGQVPTLQCLSLYRCVKTEDKKERDLGLPYDHFIYIDQLSFTCRSIRSVVRQFQVIVVLIRVITKIKSSIY